MLSVTLTDRHIELCGFYGFPWNSARIVLIEAFCVDRMFPRDRMLDQLWDCGTNFCVRSREPQLAFPESPLSPQDDGVLF